MLNKLSEYSDGPELTAAGILQSILDDLGLQDMHVVANEPCVALIDSTRWRVRSCELMDDICTKRNIVVPHLIVEHTEAKASLRCCNAHMTSNTAATQRKQDSIREMCRVAAENITNGIVQHVASMSCIIAGDLNIDEGNMFNTCRPFANARSVACRNMVGRRTMMHSKLILRCHKALSSCPSNQA